VTLTWNNQQLGRKLGGRMQGSEAQLMQGLAAIRKGDEDLGQRSRAVTIDAAQQTPWSEVIHVIDESRKIGFEQVWFTTPPSEDR
jgi:biopolymer transport protein ExbD